MKRSTEFYDKLLKNIVLIFCFLFLVFINILHFYQLHPAQDPVQLPEKENSSYLSFVFFPLQNQTRMIFIQNRFDQTYTEAVLKKINLQKNTLIVFLNCTEDPLSEISKKWKNTFSDQHFSEESCDISLQRFQELYHQNALFMIAFKNRNLKHTNALKFAYQNHLAPKTVTVEIKK